MPGSPSNASNTPRRINIPRSTRRCGKRSKPGGCISSPIAVASTASTPVSVSKTCLVRFDSNKYSVMARAVGRPFDVHAYADRIIIRQDGHIVGEHARRFDRGQTIYDPRCWPLSSVSPESHVGEMFATIAGPPVAIKRSGPSRWPAARIRGNCSELSTAREREFNMPHSPQYSTFFCGRW